MGTTATGRRNRSWPEALKREIVAASFAPASSVSMVARQYDVNANQVFNWRKRYRDEPRAPAVLSAPQLIPVVVAAEPDVAATQPTTGPATIEIDLCGKYRVFASAAASMRGHCGACSMCWSGDDPGSLWCAGLACGRTNRYEARAKDRAGRLRVAKGGRLGAQRLTDKSVCDLVEVYAARLGLKPADFGAHSLRAGFLTSAARRGASVFKMRDVSRHKSMDVLQAYVRDADLFRDHAGAGLL
jgi:transposase-like protein